MTWDKILLKDVAINARASLVCKQIEKSQKEEMGRISGKLAIFGQKSCDLHPIRRHVTLSALHANKLNVYHDNMNIQINFHQAYISNA